jgi:XapX domain-containing protein
MPYFISFLVGFLIGFVCFLFKLPLPAPDNVGGILSIIGLFTGYIIFK